jgi:hydrogenase nickel incorporation protein HypA/HybF
LKERALHELAITCNIVELVAQAANGRKVHRVTIEIGKLSGVLPDAIAFCFPEVAKGAGLEDARLDIREIEGLARCEACGTEFLTPSMLTTCPCGALQFERLKGAELNIKSIELDEAL